MQMGIQYATADRVIITYELPLAEVLFDFHDKLKSVVARLRLDGLRAHRLPRRTTSCKLDMLVNGEPLDALSVIVHRDKRLHARPRRSRRS